MGLVRPERDPRRARSTLDARRVDGPQSAWWPEGLRSARARGTGHHQGYLERTPQAAGRAVGGAHASHAPGDGRRDAIVVVRLLPHGLASKRDQGRTNPRATPA